MSLTLVILAAGRASRYGRLKQLDPVGPHGACLMDYGIHDAARSGFDRFVLVVPPGLEETFAAHAVLVAGPLLGGPFAVANADDHYGREAYGALARHLETHEAEAALVGYPLAATLSDHGGVSRGICETDTAGYLTTLVEAKEVRRSGREIHGLTVDGRPLRLRGTEPASMNLWGFPHRLLDLLHRRWMGFLERHGSDPTAEFLLSTAVHELVGNGEVRLRVLPTDAGWFGMTFSDDGPAVRHRIAELVSNGEYPDHLREGLS